MPGPWLLLPLWLCQQSHGVHLAPLVHQLSEAKSSPVDNNYRTSTQQRLLGTRTCLVTNKVIRYQYLYKQNNLLKRRLPSHEIGLTAVEASICTTKSTKSSGFAGLSTVRRNSFMVKEAITSKKHKNCVVMLSVTGHLGE